MRQTLVSFDQDWNHLTWHSLGDQVMGGQSDGALTHAEEGVGLFHGTVRLDKDDGFSSVKADLAAIPELSWQGFSSTAGDHDDALYDALVGQNR